MSKVYTHLFFDLDHTLWDTDRNSAEVLIFLYQQYQLNALGIFDANIFIETFKEVNHWLWLDYEEGRISKEELIKDRFVHIFAKMGANPQCVPKKMSSEYGELCFQKPHLIPFAKELLLATKDRFQLHIITNGSENQWNKLKSSGIDHFFKNVFHSENTGYKKPDREIFDLALKISQAKISESLMIGDSPHADIRGANKVGMDSVFCDFYGKTHQEFPTYQVKSLAEILPILGLQTL